MMTEKQKWFILKLMKEIEKIGNCKISANDTVFGSNEFNPYRTSKKEASNDIGYLLKIKELMSNNMGYVNAREIALNEIFA